MRSRGRLTAVALFRSAARCSSIAVSERWVPESWPYLPLPSPRLSEPSSRMFSAVVASGSTLGRSDFTRISSWAVSVSVRMFPSSCL